MSFLEALQPEERAIVERLFHPVQFPEESVIVREGDPGDGCYLIDKGEVRVEIQNVETNSDGVIGYLRPGDFLGEISLLDGKPRSASAYAQTEVEARWLSKADFEELYEQYPRIGLAVFQSLGQNLTTKLRRSTASVAGYIFADEIDDETNEMVERAVTAQREFEGWSEEQVDALLHAVAQTMGELAEQFAEATVAETDIGVVADKVMKIRYACNEMYQALAGRSASGLLQRDPQRQVSELASPVGVVLGLVPVTNPVPTIIFKTLISLKGRNAIIVSCHHDALKVGNWAVDMIRSVLHRQGAPRDLVQSIRERTSRQKTRMFMIHPDVSLILATGGPSMVRSAYSSGTPAIGVGAGNAPVWICPDADLDQAAQMIVGSKAFDNGLTCASENNLVVDISVRATFIERLEAHGAVILTPDEKRRFTVQLFDPERGHLKGTMVGKSAQVIAEATGIRRPRDFRLIVVPVERGELQGPYGMEKLAPIVSLFTVDGDEDGLDFCKQILAIHGRGHTAVVHTRDKELAERFGREMPASRILVNAPAFQGCIGIGTGLTPSYTLGCGTFGGNSTTDNVSFTHLLNIKRLAFGF